MNISDELQKLQDLHRSGALTDDEFTAAKAAVLAKNTTEGQTANEPAMQSHLEQIKLQNELSRLDREWQMEREQYMIAGRYGYRYVPSQGLSILGGIVVVGFGIFWTAMAASMGAPVFFPLFGVIFILAGVGMSIYSFSKASAYQQAQQRYQQRRSRLLTERGEQQRER